MKGQAVADRARLFLRLLSDYLIERDAGASVDDMIEGAYWPAWAGQRPDELLSPVRSARKRRERWAAFTLVMAYGYGREALRDLALDTLLEAYHWFALYAEARTRAVASGKAAASADVRHHDTNTERERVRLKWVDAGQPAPRDARKFAGDMVIQGISVSEETIRYTWIPLYMSEPAPSSSRSARKRTLK
ncbi:MAG TPA: hypothetical protein VHM00_09155 [Caldimonas sp.]|jgi:hypothetical protein|nr:hypothetical protein [Caldimonas sp.]HEX2541236.1 hypothetical protein [Caldimonas sp.]